MSGQPKSADREARPRSAFSTTHWSLVRAAGKVDSPESMVALETLCRTYWYPVYAHIRHRGYRPEDARDHTQGFFLQLLESHALGKADMSRGRFRSFLLSSLRHYLQHVREHDHAQKRGGDSVFFSWDDEKAEARFSAAAVDGDSPDKCFDRHWAMTVLDNALADLRREYHAAGHEDLFRAIKPHITPDGANEAMAETAAKLGASIAAVKSAVFRLRRRYHAAIRDHVAQTVADPRELDDELRHLLAVFASS